MLMLRDFPQLTALFCREVEIFAVVFPGVFVLDDQHGSVLTQQNSMPSITLYIINCSGQHGVCFDLLYLRAVTAQQQYTLAARQDKDLVRRGMPLHRVVAF